MFFYQYFQKGFCQRYCGHRRKRYLFDPFIEEQNSLLFCQAVYSLPQLILSGLGKKKMSSGFLLLFQLKGFHQTLF
jgi:hypothetical protein